MGSFFNLINSDIRNLTAQDALDYYAADVHRTDGSSSVLAKRFNAVQGMFGELSELLMLNMAIAGLGQLNDFDKKVEHNGHPDDTARRIDELGDFMFYLTLYMELHGIKLIDVLEQNITKRARRYPNGYSHADSIARRDKAGQEAGQAGEIRTCSGCGGELLTSKTYVGPGGKGYHKECAIRAGWNIPALTRVQAASKGIKFVGEAVEPVNPLD